MSTIVRSLDIGPGASQVAVIRFGTSASVIFNLTTYDNKTNILTAISGIAYSGGGTETDLALNLLLSSGFIGARPESEGIPRVAIVVTDGKSNNAGRTVTAAAAVHAAQPKITVFAAGIGGFDLVELQAIASDPDSRFVQTITGFSVSELLLLTEDLRDETCHGEYGCYVLIIVYESVCM